MRKRFRVDLAPPAAERLAAMRPSHQRRARQVIARLSEGLVRVEKGRWSNPSARLMYSRMDRWATGYGEVRTHCVRYFKLRLLCDELREEGAVVVLVVSDEREMKRLILGSYEQRYANQVFSALMHGRWYRL